MLVWDYGYVAKTDDRGGFQFDGVIPGPGTVGRVVVTRFRDSSTHYPCWPTPVEIRGGETTETVIGGSGRPVVGRVVLEREPEVPVDWTTNEPATIDRWDAQANRRSDAYGRDVGPMDDAGRFRIPDVPAGDYKLTVPVNNPPTPNACGAGAEIGTAELRFSIPEIPGGRSDEPLDLGTITAKLFDTLDPGELAPDFVVQRLDGGTLRLGDFRGKLVLLDFWATWCGPCLAETPNLRRLHERFGDNPRFALISLSCDAEAAAAKQYVEKHPLPWRQAHVSGTYAKVPQDYTVRSLPATFLVGPDGRVLAKNLRGKELQRAVAASLAADALFTAVAAERPPRFPVVRFEASAEAPPNTATPAVVALDNTDPGFEKDQPHHDRLRLLSSNGEEIWSRTGFNSAGTVGGVHGVALDRQRGRIYMRENVADRIIAFDLQGRKLWQIEQVDVGTILVDDRTGNVWCSGGPNLKSGETVVFDESGNEVAAYPYRAIDMAFDPHTDAFWLVGCEIIKLARNGDVLFREAVDGWCCPSASVNPKDGSIWIAEREHPDAARSRNRLWLRSADGNVKLRIELGDSGIFAVACVPSTGEALLSGYKAGLRRASLDGKLSTLATIPGNSISVSPSSGDIWVATEKAVLRIDNAGGVEARSPFAAPSAQSWIAAY